MSYLLYFLCPLFAEILRSPILGSRNVSSRRFRQNNETTGKVANLRQKAAGSPALVMANA
jgi:hypothetical protein